MKEYAIVISDVPKTSRVVDEEDQKGIGYEKGILKNKKTILLTPKQIIRDVGQLGMSCYPGYYELQDGEKYFRSPIKFM